MSKVVGLAKEIKQGEFRVALSPSGVAELIKNNINCIVETGAGFGVGYSDSDYEKVGAKIVSRKELFEKSEVLVKVKELQSEEIEMLQPDQILFAYLHLAGDKIQTEGLLKKKITGIAWETITADDGSLPLLQPMSDIAGKLAVQHGAYYLTKVGGSAGILLSGIAGVKRGKVLIIGGGIVGMNSAKMAIGLGAEVVIADKSLKKLNYLETIFGDRVSYIYATDEGIKKELPTSDLIIGAALIPGAKAPIVVNREMLKLIRPGSVMVDVAIDQGGCFETSKITSHKEPTFEIDGVIHYCVPNMPGLVARTASAALNVTILPYTIKLAKFGLDALKNDKHFAKGLNVYDGKITYKAVAESLNMPFDEINY